MRNGICSGGIEVPGWGWGLVWFSGFWSFGSGDSLDWITGTRNHEGIYQSGTGSWRCGLGVVWRCSVVGDSVSAFELIAAPSKINRALQNLSLVIFSSIFALKIFAQNLNRYALMYCNRNANATKTNTASQSSRRCSNLNDEPYALRSNLTVLQKSAGRRASRDVTDVQPLSDIDVVSEVHRGVMKI